MWRIFQTSNKYYNYKMAVAFYMDFSLCDSHFIYKFLFFFLL